MEVRQTAAFEHWLGRLDPVAKTRIVARIVRLGQGNFGDVKPVGLGISELRTDFGPGYRVYLCADGADAVLLLTGGTKKTQRADIRRAVYLRSLR